MTSPRRVVVVGAGITGLTSALTLLTQATSPVAVTVLESSGSTGGVIRTSPFASLPAVDEGADAFLTRVPWARELADEVGLGGDLVHPRNAGAYVWHDGFHSIPHDLLLGIPASLKVFATGSLLSARGKLRAAMEPLLPRRDSSHDCIGTLVRRRFGNEVQERLVDPLVGSIYAADTDHFSLESVPQIHALASERSLLWAAQKARTRTTLGGPVFASPRLGMGSLVAAVHAKVLALGGEIAVNTRVDALTKSSGDTYTLRTHNGAVEADAVILATPAMHTAPMVRDIAPRVAGELSSWSHASVVMLTMAVPRSQWPARLTGSGYLVPKPDQRWVTAASFGSNKWAHWNPDDRSMILRVSLGRDGHDVMNLDDDTLINLALADLTHHLDVDLQPQHIRLTRWPNSFPQYRPHHVQRVSALFASLADSAPRVHLAGASYRGIGVPACVEQARHAATVVLSQLGSLTQ